MKFSPSSSFWSSPNYLNCLSYLNLIDLIEHLGGFMKIGDFFGRSGFGSIKITIS